MLGWAIATWLAVAGCAIWWLTWLVVAASWPYYELFAVSSGAIGFVMGAVTLALANEVASTS